MHPRKYKHHIIDYACFYLYDTNKETEKGKLHYMSASLHDWMLSIKFHLLLCIERHDDKIYLMQWYFSIFLF